MSRGGGGGFREWPLDCKIYVGNLGDEGTERELGSVLEEAFSKYGTVRQCWIARNPAGFAFILMDDPRDAEDAARSLDGTRMCGRRVVVEMSHGRARRGRRSGPGGGGGGGGGGRSSSGYRDGGGRYSSGSGGGGYRDGGGRYRDRSPSPRGGGGGGRRFSRSRSRSRSRDRRMKDRRSRSRSKERGGSRGRGRYDEMNGRGVSP